MATKKSSLTAEQAYRGALVNLALTGFQVTVAENPYTARILHPLAATLPPGTDVSTTKLVFQQYQDRVEVDGKRVALGEVISRAMQASLADVEQAQRGLEHKRKVEVEKTVQYEHLAAAGFEKALKGFAFTGGKYDRKKAESLSIAGKLAVRLERGEKNGNLILTVEADAEAYGALAKLITAAAKAA